MIIDVSKHQGKINWDALAPHVDVAILKATGDLYEGVDPYFHANARACVERGIPIHGFCYSRAHSKDEARREARLLVETAGLYHPVSYVLDLEGEALADVCAVANAQAFMSELRALGARKIGLYTGHYAYLEHGLEEIDHDWLWIARYGKNTGEIPPAQYHPVPCDLWQYTSQASVPGITENTVDVSVIWGDKPMSYFTGEDDLTMTVMIGSARGDENGRAYGGQPGDQTGKEVSRQPWYKHPQGWRVFRAKDAEAREKIGACMDAACDNSHIGYDQNDRLTLYSVAEGVDFDCGKVEIDCETDCSALVRVCCAFAKIDLPNFNTQYEPEILARSGAFDELTGAAFTDYSDRLMRGDILVTRGKGHTAVVLNDGDKTGKIARGDVGDEVTALQKALVRLGYNLGSYGANRDGVDGEFGAKTEAAVKAFQKANGLPQTGMADAATLALLYAPEKTYTVTIRGLQKAEMEAMKGRWPDAEVSEE